MDWHELLKSVKCNPSGRKIDLISSKCDILSQMWYHCAQYTRRHLMSLILHCYYHFLQKLLIWACYLFLRYSALPGTTFVTVSQLLMKWGPFFVRQDNIWQTLAVIFATYWSLVTVPRCHLYMSWMSYVSSNSIWQCFKCSWTQLMSKSAWLTEHHL